VKERPILFSALMVRKLLDPIAPKLQTRRVIKAAGYTASTMATFRLMPDGEMLLERWPKQERSMNNFGRCDRFKCPYGIPGDRLWVRESWAYRLDCDHLNGTQLYESGVREAWYWADGPGRCCNTGCMGAAGRVRAARFMPRWASRITLEITDVRVQRVQDISEEDAKAEGITEEMCQNAAISQQICHEWIPSRPWACGYRYLWDSINLKKHPWASNPWTWCITFKML
jgi:hypothetical protein